MSRKYSFQGVIASFIVVGCAAVLPSTSAAQAQTTPRNAPAPVVTADRDDMNDTLEDRIEFRLETNDVTRKYDIDVEVENGVATLTGEVATERQKTQALEMAKVDGVVRIEDRIEVDADADRTLAERAKQGLNKAGEKITDAWITTKVNWFFVGEDVLDGSDIDVDTKDNVVTLKGTVRSEAARARAKVLAERTDGVKSVRDELIVR
jgi:hyperosmotically inducible protein